MASWCLFVGAFIFLALAFVFYNTPQRENLQFVNYTDPIFPDGQVYVDQYWPRTGGQLGQNLFTGWPQYFKAY